MHRERERERERAQSGEKSEKVSIGSKLFYFVMVSRALSENGPLSLHAWKKDMPLSVSHE